VIRSTGLLVLVLMAIGFASSRAWAGERVVGPGYAFDIPDRFDAEAGPWEVVARATTETLVQGLPFRPAAEPRMRFYAVPGAKGPEAVLVACRFDVLPDDALTSVEDLPPSSIRTAFEHAMDTLPGGKLLRTSRDRLAGHLPAEISVFTYPHPTAGQRTVHSCVVVNDTSCFLLLLDSPSNLDVEYQAYFASIGESVRMLKPAPKLLEQMRYPIVGLAGLLALLLVFSVTMRVRRARAHRRREALTPPPRMHVIAVDEEISVHDEPAAADPADEPAPESDDAAAQDAPVPAELYPAAAPATRARAGLRSTFSGEVPSDAAPALEPSPVAPAAPVAEADPEPATGSPMAEDAEPAPRSPTIRIQRNADFV
jgi:hypothetical protein